MTNLFILLTAVSLALHVPYPFPICMQQNRRAIKTLIPYMVTIKSSFQKFFNIVRYFYLIYNFSTRLELNHFPDKHSLALYFIQLLRKREKR